MELATEHVRMLDAGRQRIAYSSSLTSSCFESVASIKAQLLQHGNTFGLSFLATERGFVMTKNDDLENSCTDYRKRRQEALDHGQKLTLEEIHELPVAKEIHLPSIAYWIALSPDELMVAVAYTDSVALFEVAHIVEAMNPAPFHTFSKLQAQEIAWCTDPDSEQLAVLTLEKRVVVCTLDGAKNIIDTQSDVSSISWSPSGEQIALGLVDSTIAIYERASLQIVRSIGEPKCCADAGLEVHHVNWAEEELILAGYQKYDEENEETSALACIFENGECVELDEVVGFFDVENRRHQYFSAFLPDWRMFFIGCSLSADIELLVSDPEGGEWELWKPLEKYQARLPMNVEDEESFPMGLALNLNSTSPIPVDEDAFPPVPIISCSNTEGLLVNFAFVDTTVNEVEFVKSPLPFEKSATRFAVAKEKPKALETAATGGFQLTSDIASQGKTASPNTISHEYGQNDENEFAESDGESSDEEEERKEEEDKARTTFRTIASDGADFIPSGQFPKLIKAMGSTYSEEEHASTLKSLEKDGNVYEADFVSWYVNWIFSDGDSDSDADIPTSSAAKPAEMKSKEEIAAAFSRFSAKEGSWKCGVCMVNNGPEAMKCSACEASNPAAPKVVTPVTTASATSAGSIGLGGFSFPASTGEASKPSSFSFGATPDAATADATKPSGFSFGDTAPTSGFSFPSSTTTSGTGFSFPTTAKPATGLGFGSSTVSASTAGNSAYPPDTMLKPKPPVFGDASNSGYPPDTTKKPKPPAFGTSSGDGYPPDTTKKPKPPAFGVASGSGHPPDTTSKPKPRAFGASTTCDKTTSSSSFAFGKNRFGSQTELSASTNSSVQGNNSSIITPTKPKSIFGSSFGNGGATDTSSSPFGVNPKSSSKSAFSFGPTCASDLKDLTRKTNTARPGFSFDTLSLTTDTTEECDSPKDQPPTKRTLNFGDMNAFEAKTNPVPTAKMKAMAVVGPAQPSKSIPSSQMEGQLWKLIVDFDKSLQRVNQSSKNISSNDPAFSKNLLAKMDELHAQISNLCDEVNHLDESRDKIEKDVLFVIGSDGDVHEQLEYSREILNSFNDEALKRTLEAQPLDQRSKETWESLNDKLNEAEKCCLELDSHLSSFKLGAGGIGAVSSAHLFRVLKQTYDNSKMQYNKVCELAEHLEKLSLRGDRMRQANGVGGVTAVESESHPLATKADMVEMIVETEQRNQDVRRNFLSLCNNVVTPRDVFSTPRRKLAPPVPSDSSPSPLRVKAWSKLMPKTQLSVASPMSSAKQSSRSVSFKSTPIRSGSKLFSLAEAMAPKGEPAKFVQTPQPAKPSVSVGKAPQRPSLGAPATEAKPASTTSSTAATSNVFSFPKPSKETESSFAAASANTDNMKTVSTTSSFGGFGVNSPAVKSKPKADARPTSAFSLGAKEAPASSPTFSFGSKDAKSTVQPLSTGSVTPDYKALLETFYKVHNPIKTGGGVIEKALTTYKGREEDLFARLFSMYVPDSTPDAVKQYLNGGPVPPKSESVAAASKSPTPVATAKSPFGGSATAQSSPFGASPSAFTLGSAANKSSGFGGFGSTATMSSSTSSTTTTPFGKPAVDYHQKLVEFYQKHNPDKLSSVDATLQKYKGNEEKLFQNLAVKYKVNNANGGVSIPPASPVVQPAKPNAAASPFGKAGAFLAPTTSSGSTFGSASLVNFGAATPSPATSPFGAAQTLASSPFGAASQISSGFGSAGGSGFGSGFQSTSSTTPAFSAPSSFGATASGFGAAGGVNYREKLTTFYQQHNPAKLSSVDPTLEKYRGREDHLFAMLEQKYVKKAPTVPTTGDFGIPSTSTFGGGSGFGAPSGLGVASAAPAFGSASTLGSTAQPAFGGAAGLGFGMASHMGGGFGSAAPAASSGGASGSGFGAFGSQSSTFGGAAQQSGGFGAAAANSGGFGSSFGGSATTSSFGQPTAFTSSSFTQMR